MDCEKCEKCEKCTETTCQICAYCEYYGGGNYDWDWVDVWVEDDYEEEEITYKFSGLPGYAVPYDSEDPFDIADLVEADSLKY